MESTTNGRNSAIALAAYKDLLSGIESVPTPDGGFISEVTFSGSVNPSDFLPSEGEHINSIDVFSKLLFEVHDLIAEATNDHMPSFLIYAERVTANDSIEVVASFMEGLYGFSEYFTRVNQVFRVLLQQLYAFHTEIDTAPVMLNVWIALGDLLSVIMQLDAIIGAYPAIQSSWKTFMKIVDDVDVNASSVDITTAEVVSAKSRFALIEGQIMSTNGLRNCYEQSYGDLDDSSSFAKWMKSVILTLYGKWEKAAADDIPEKRRLMAILGLGVFYFRHFTKPEKKVLKTLWSSHKKVALFHLCGTVMWSPGQFLRREVPEVAEFADKKTLQALQNSGDGIDSKALLTEIDELVQITGKWDLSICREIKQAQIADPMCSLKIAELVLRGCRLADSISRLLRTALNCQSGALKLSRQDASRIFDAVESVKSISRTLASEWRHVRDACRLSCQQWRCHLLNLLDETRTSLRTNSTGNNSLLQIEAVNVAINVLLSTATAQRLQICMSALAVANYEKLIRAVDVMQVDTLIARIMNLCNPENVVARMCDCSFLYFHPSLISIYWETFMDRRPDCYHAENFCEALSDCMAYSLKQRFDPVPEDLLWNMIFGSIKKGLLIPVAHLIENDLRVLTHKHLVIADSDLTPPDSYEFLQRIMAQPQISIYDYVIDIREFVTMHLQKNFYNLSLIALHDLHSYRRMIVLAQLRYGLDLWSDLLPESLRDEKDVTEYIRDLPVFVKRFNYCINQHMFIEKSSLNRTLKIITTDQLTSALRGHRYLMGATVNATYKVLRKNLGTFCHFLSDEHIAAQLQRDWRYFETKRTKLDQMYPLKRAEKFNSALAKLSPNDEESYMDKFRSLVTQIGNAVAFVRSFSASARILDNQSRQYDDEELFQDEDLTEKSSSGPIEELRSTLTDLRDSARTEGFILKLVDVFHQELANTDKYPKVEHFFVLVPPLTLSYLHYMLTCRERLKKRGTQNREVTFVDDGFVMGVAFLLSVVGQWRSFLLLNWMSSLRKSLEEDMQKIDKDLNEAKDRRPEALKMNRISDLFREYELLLFGLQSSRVIFSSEDDYE